MKCVICNNDNAGDTAMCTNCGADMFINKRIKNISIRLYNNGISLAKKRKLSEAARELQKSLYFDRFNIDALNVLGLIYFELGMIGDALKHWATSASYLSHGNLANLYLKRIKDNVREMDKMNDAVKMYNKGLYSVMFENDDMAIIQLKKAVEMNYRFITAKTLLAFVYSRLNDNANAMQLIDSVLSYDIGNAEAITYKAALSENISAPMPVTAKSHAPAHQEHSQKQTGVSYTPKKGFPLSEIVSLAIGASFAVAAMYFLVIPSIKDAAAAEIDKLNGVITTMEQSHKNELALKNEEINVLSGKNTELQGENEEMLENAKRLENQQKIATAASFNASGNIKEAATILFNMDETGLTESELSQYNTLKQATYPAVASAFFNEGRAFYNTKRYDEAKSALNNGLTYGMTESNAGDSYYFLGRIAENDENTEDAKNYYSKTVNEFPRCTQFYNASNRLRALG